MVPLCFWYHPCLYSSCGSCCGSDSGYGCRIDFGFGSAHCDEEWATENRIEKVSESGIENRGDVVGWENESLLTLVIGTVCGRETLFQIPMPCPLCTRVMGKCAAVF